MELHRRVLKRLKKIRRMQERYNMAKRMGVDLSAFAVRPAFTAKVGLHQVAGLDRSTSMKDRYYLRSVLPI